MSMFTLCEKVEDTDKRNLKLHEIYQELLLLKTLFGETKTQLDRTTVMDMMTLEVDLAGKQCYGMARFV